MNSIPLINKIDPFFCKYDWFEINDTTVCISIHSDKHYTIKEKDGKYHLLFIDLINFDADHLSTNDDFMSLLRFVERQLVSVNSYMLRDTEWKSENASLAQMQYSPTSVTKWDIHKSFVLERYMRLSKKLKKEKMEGEKKDKSVDSLSKLN